MGPPGSGKGTQTKLLSEKLGLVNFDTGQYLEKLLYNPRFKKNKEIQRERRNFESGKLLTPSWVLKITKKAVEKIAKVNLGVIFSGSPRTFFEAFGDKKQEGLIALLEKYYGKKNIFVFKIEIPAGESIKRNSQRLICSVCSAILLAWYSKLKGKKENCPFCGAPLRRRTLDKPEIIKIRLTEYQNRTKPVLEGIKKRGYRIIFVNGAPSPYKIHQKISSYLN